MDENNSNESTLSALAGWLLLSVVLLTPLAGGVAMAYWGLSTAAQEYATINWSTTPGTILASEAVHDHNPGDDANYWWDLRYEYKIGDQKFTSSRYSVVVPTGRSHRFSLRSSTYDLAESNYHAGDSVTVAFDPQNKKMSVLNTDFSGWSIVLSIAGVTLCTIIGIIVIRNLLKLRQSSP